MLREWLASHILHRAETKSLIGFVRLCRNRQEFINIINEARVTTVAEWEEDHIRRVHEYIVCNEIENISVYRLNALTALDVGHALGVISEGITQKNFRSTAKKRESACTRGGLLIPIDKFEKSLRYKHTPRGNLDFYPANNYHYDLRVLDKKAFGVDLLNSLRDNSTRWVLLGNSDSLKGSYTLQARIAYSSCVQQFGPLNALSPPKTWCDGATLSASEQLDTIAFLAQLHSIENPDTPIVVK